MVLRQVRLVFHRGGFSSGQNSLVSGQGVLHQVRMSCIKLVVFRQVRAVLDQVRVSCIKSGCLASGQGGLSSPQGSLASGQGGLFSVQGGLSSGVSTI